MFSAWWLVGPCCCFLLAVGAAGVHESCEPLPVARAGAAQACDQLFLWGLQGSGSTFAWQVLSRVADRAFGRTGVVVRKGHYLRRGSMQLANGTNCVAGTIRDFRDVICSHARRGGFQNIPACQKCDAEALERSGTAAKVFGALFGHRGGQAAEAQQLQREGALILRYESFVGCPRQLIIAFGAWLGSDLGRSANETDFEGWIETVVRDTSLEKNLERAKRVGSSFRKNDPNTRIHGHHISNMGKVGGWRACLTPSVQAHVRKQIGPLLAFFNYTDGTDT